MSNENSKSIEFTVTYKNEDNTRGMNKKVVCENIDKAVEWAVANCPEGFFPESIVGADGSMWF
jgi:hypothetical protein